MRPLKLTRSGLLGTLAVFVIAAICVRLGFWQLDRRAERLERNAAIAERMAERPVVIRSAPTDTTGLPYRPAQLVGRFDNDRAIVLAGRSHAGAPGAHLLTPLRVGDGAILVNRGWLPAPDAATVDVGAVALEDEVRVEGVLMPFPDVRLDREPESDFRRTWFRFDGDAIRAQYRYPVSPVYLLATSRPAPIGASGPAAATGLPVILEPPGVDPGPHLSYAVQWFAFATIAVVGWAILLVRRSDDDSHEPGVDRG